MIFPTDDNWCIRRIGTTSWLLSCYPILRAPVVKRVPFWYVFGEPDKTQKLPDKMTWQLNTYIYNIHSFNSEKKKELRFFKFRLKSAEFCFHLFWWLLYEGFLEFWGYPKSWWVSILMVTQQSRAQRVEDGINGILAWCQHVLVKSQCYGTIFLGKFCVFTYDLTWFNDMVGFTNYWLVFCSRGLL